MSRVSVFSSWSLAPLTTAPVESVTVPAMDAEKVWARATRLIRTAISTPSRTKRGRRREENDSEPISRNFINSLLNFQASTTTTRLGARDTSEKEVYGAA